MKRKTFKLDEQQERKLIEIESRSFRLVFWGLLIVCCVEMLVMEDFRMFIGEFILLLIISLYSGVSCIRAGITHSRQVIGRKNRFIGALSVSVAIAVLRPGYIWISNHTVPLKTIVVSIVLGVVVFSLSYFAFYLETRYTEKRRDELNAEPEDEDVL